MPSKFICLMACVRVTFLKTEFLCVFGFLSPTDGHLGYFCLLSYVQGAELLNRILILINGVILVCFSLNKDSADYVLNSLSTFEWEHRLL